MDPKELIDLIDRFEESTLAQFYRDFQPIFRIVNHLSDVGMETYKTGNIPAPKHLSPAEMCEELEVSRNTLLNYQRRWPWFRPDPEVSKKGRGQKYCSSLIPRVKRALADKREVG